MFWCSPLQTVPPRASPWRSAVAAGTRRQRCPSWSESPRWGRGRRTCCFRWRPAVARYQSRRSVVRCYGNTGAVCTGWHRAQHSLLHTLLERHGRSFSFSFSSFHCSFWLIPVTRYTSLSFICCPSNICNKFLLSYLVTLIISMWTSILSLQLNITWHLLSLKRASEVPDMLSCICSLVHQWGSLMWMLRSWEESNWDSVLPLYLVRCLNVQSHTLQLLPHNQPDVMWQEVSRRRS